MKKDETAIILIEFQNDFTTEGGIFHDAVKNVMDETNMLSNTFDLVEKARKEGVHVIHIPISFTENYSELTSNPYGILKGIVDNNAFQKNSWGIEIHEKFTPQNSSSWKIDVEEGDLVLFPSWLKHGVEPNLNKKENRISLAFNISATNAR